MSEDIVVSAPTRLFLSGIEGIARGGPAILTALSWRVAVSVIRKGKGMTVLPRAFTQDTEKILDAVKRAYKLHAIPPLEVNVSFSVPGDQFGVHTAFTVAAVGAIAYALKGLWNPSFIHQIAYELEKSNHPFADAESAISTYGGYLWYRQELSFLKSMWQLPIRSKPPLVHLWCIDTKMGGRPIQKKSDLIDCEFEEQTRRVTTALKEGDVKAFTTALRQEEQLLEQAGAVEKEVIVYIREIERSGGAAKAVGESTVLCWHPQEGRLNELSQRFHLSIRKVSIGDEGIRLERGRRDS